MTITADSIMYAQERVATILRDLQFRQRAMKAEIAVYIEANDLQSAASRQQMFTGLVMAENLVRDEQKDLMRRLQCMIDFERQGEQA